MTQQTRLKVIVAMPAYNEEKYIGTLVLEAKQYADEVIVLDDGSTDETSKIARLAGATVIRHEQNKGKGAAIQSILAEAKRRAPDALVLLDADAQHHTEDIPKLVTPILNKEADIIIGSRFLKPTQGTQLAQQTQGTQVPFYRRIGQKVLLHSTYILSGKKLTDSESGFRVFSREAITLLELRENGMSVSAETIAAAADRGLKVTEIPISITYTRDGSTLNPVSHGVGVLARIIAMISERRPLLFFGLGGGISTLLGLLAGARVLSISAAGGGVATGIALVSALLLTIGIFSIFTGVILNVLIKRRD